MRAKHIIYIFSVPLLAKMGGSVRFSAETGYFNRFRSKCGMTIMGFLVLYGMAVSLSFCSLYAGTGVSGFEFLRLPESAKAVALGNAYSAYSNDSLSVFYNPAGLSEVRWMENTASASLYLLDMYYGVLSYAMPVSKNSSVGAGVKYFSAGEFKKRGDTLDEAGSFSPSAATVSLGWGIAINEISAGASVKGAYQKIYEKTNAGFMLDLGGKYHLEADEDLIIDFGCVMKNIGTESGELVISPAPLQISPGIKASLLDKTLNITAEGLYAVPEKNIKISGGIEYTILDMFSVRLGYRYGEYESIQDRVSAGFGLQWTKVYDFFIDYGFSMQGPLGFTNHLTTGIRY